MLPLLALFRNKKQKHNFSKIGKHVIVQLSQFGPLMYPQKKKLNLVIEGCDIFMNDGEILVGKRMWMRKLKGLKHYQVPIRK